MRVLVTGGAGFIGSNLADALIEAGYDVTIVDNLSTGKRANVPPQAEFHQLDICSPVFHDIFAENKFHIVAHLAAQTEVRCSVADPKYDAQVNIVGGLNVLNACLQHRVKKFVFSSTGGAMYGEGEQLPSTEAHPADPLSPYGLSKYVFEKYLKYYGIEYGLSYVILRLANVYGPRQNSKGEAGVVAIFCDKLMSDQKALINGDGFQTRDFIFVDDVVRAMLLAMVHHDNEIFNVGSSLEIDINTIYDRIKKTIGSDQPRIYADAKSGEQRRSCLSYERIRDVLGWAPTTTLTEGIKRTVDYFKYEANKLCAGSS